MVRAPRWPEHWPPFHKYQIPKKEENKVAPAATLISLFRDKDRKKKEVDGLQGNCFILKAKDFALIMDTMKSGALDKILAEIKDSKTIDLYLSHMHGDHVGNVQDLIKKVKIRRCYLQARDTVAQDHRQRYDDIVSACKKHGVKVIVLKKGDSFDCGNIHAKILFQQKDGDLNMRSLCALFTVGGRKILYCGDHHCGTDESDFKFDDHVDVYLSAHHGLYTGDKERFIKKIKPDYIIRAGWKSWPLGTIEKDSKVKDSDKTYQKYGNLLPGDICGRTQLDILTDTTISVTGERNMKATQITTKAGKKTVHTCSKCKFHQVKSMGE